MSSAPSEPAPSERLAAMLKRQRHGFAAEGAPSLDQRRADITRLRDAVKRQAHAIADAIAEDFGGRARHETLLAEVWPVHAAARHALRRLPRWMKPRRVPVGLEFRPSRAEILVQPLGVVGIIAPWNYPVNLALAPLIAALAAGNRVMLKPSELTPRTSDLLAKMLGELFPDDKVAVVQGGSEIGAAFAGLPFDHLFFTGSTAVGRKVMLAAAQNLTPVTLELGGKSPCVIGPDARLAEAALRIATGKLFNAGQTCIAPDYALVPRDKLEEFVTAYAAAARKLYPTLRRNADYTAILNDRHLARLNSALSEARAAGARIVAIDPAAEGDMAAERKIAPTLVIEPRDDLTLMREEIFGPILPVKAYDRLDDAIEFIASRPRPLALYYFGIWAEHRERVLAGAHSGGVSVNDVLTHFVVEDLPFGGIGPSGLGAYHGETGFQTFSHRRAVYHQGPIDPKFFLRPPYSRIFPAIFRFLMRN
ncbi:coniferyl aldehyde dehydrogenase [Rhodoblastus sp.]|uniref:coniferyl aldehyde dehydrogenase n=1 Tax=Rhodoblastus sp. TaxID=1962975 RepID=UPI002603B06F|nr:coniferyl aldehyde dehydrogenase [Rhodoblastus sp.]